MKKILKYLLGIIIVAYISVSALIYFKPTWFFYNPYSNSSSVENARKYGYKAEEVKYKSADGTELFAWYTKPEKGKSIIVFMHGNSYNVEEFYHKLIPLAAKGYGTFLPEYRGFGGVKGEINQKNLEADAVAAVNELHKLGYKNSEIIVYGMSLGSHMATNTVYQLQNEGTFKALILEVPFDSLLNVVKDTIPVPMPLAFLMKDHYDNLEMIKSIKSPVLVMGGSIDPTIPIKLAKNLYEQAKEPKKMIIYANGKHSNLYNFRNYDDILSWLEKNEKGIK